ncbi:hypothetical protein V8F20_011262 [Naviculisporaceae sp. PSN 640]
MFSSTSRSLVSGMAGRRLANSTPARPLSQLTMGMAEIAEWKEGKARASGASNAKPTIFDLKVLNPINKSNTWNITYDPEVKRKPEPESDEQWLFQMERARAGSRRLAAQRLRLPTAGNTFSSLAVKYSPTSIQESVFGSERSASEILDVPDMPVLAQLHPEAPKKPSDGTQNENTEKLIANTPATPEDDPNNKGSDDIPSTIGCPPWFS